MRLVVTSLVCLLAGSVACRGQGTPAPATPALATPAPTTAAPAPAAAAPAPETTASGKPKAKDVRANCRAEAQAKGLKGADKKSAVQECFAKVRPDLAAGAECRKQGKAKGLADTELRAFVKTCKQGKS